MAVRSNDDDEMLELEDCMEMSKNEAPDEQQYSEIEYLIDDEQVIYMGEYNVAESQSEEFDVAQDQSASPMSPVGATAAEVPDIDNNPSSGDPSVVFLVTVDPTPDTSDEEQPDVNESTAEEVYKAVDCSICLEHPHSRRPVSTICGHIYCYDCIETALDTWKKCPVCQKNLDMSQVHSIYI